MLTRLSNNAGNSSAEEKFVQLFCDVFGAEKGQYVYLQYPFVDIYGKHRTIDFAIKTEADKIAFEIDGETWHNPTKVSKDKYIDDLLKQNSMIHNGWKVFRWTDSQLDKTPERVKDELVTFLGYTPTLTYIDDDMPSQKGKVFELREHQEEALASLNKMREEGKQLLLCRVQQAQENQLLACWTQDLSEKEFCFLLTQKNLLNRVLKISRSYGRKFL